MNIFEILIVQPIFNLLIGLYSIIPGGDFGLAVIIFTVLVRFALYPLLKKQLHQTKMMKKLQPELKKIKARTKGNKQAEGAAMMELYKKHGVSPFRSIGILIIQLPIFIALYQVIRIFTEHRDEIEKFTYGFMQHIPAVHQLIEHPDQFHEKLFGVIDLTKSAFADGNIDIFLIIIAIVASAAQYFMSKQLMPKSDSKRKLREILADAANGKSADQSEINGAMMGKMSGILPLFMFFIMVSLPGALALYYATSNIVAVLQQYHLLKEDEEEMEEMVESAPTVIETSKSNTKKSPKSPKQREKAAKTANITRITAKESGKRR